MTIEDHSVENGDDSKFCSLESIRNSTARALATDGEQSNVPSGSDRNRGLNRGSEQSLLKRSFLSIVALTVEEKVDA